jgi:hypothetical protein
MKRFLLSIVTALTVFIACSGTVLAAPQQMPDGNVFDPEYYAAANPDVVAALGSDPAVLYQHYLLCGQKEGRLPYAPAQGAPQPAGNRFAQKRIEVFSALFLNGKLIENGKVTEQSAGSVRVEYPEGWWSSSGSGIRVYTDESALFDAAAYAAANPDIAARVGSSKAALWEQYKTEGAFAGRVAAGTSYNANAKLEIIRIAQSITTPSMSTEEKIRAVHDWMINYGSYDYSYADVSQTIEGFIYNHTAVCAGYAKTFAYFMEVLDIPCEVITGYAGGDHAWNRVAVNGQWKYIDVTWDDPLCYYNGVPQQILTYDYYLISEGQMAKDHYAQEYHDYY